MCPISRAGRGTLTPVLCCGNGLGLTAREGTAPCAATHHFSLSRMRSTSLSVLSSETQPDGKFRAFVYPNGHRSQESSQQRITVTEPFHSYWSSILQLSKVRAASRVGKRCSFRDAGSLQLPSALNLALLPPRYGLGEKVCWLGFFFLLQNLSGLRKVFPNTELTLGRATIGRICWQGNHNDQNSAGILVLQGSTEHNRAGVLLFSSDSEQQHPNLCHVPQALLPNPFTHSEQMPTHINSLSSYKQGLAFSYRWCSGTSCKALSGAGQTQPPFLEHGTNDSAQCTAPPRAAGRAAPSQDLTAEHPDTDFMWPLHLFWHLKHYKLVHPEWHMSFTEMQNKGCF